MLFHWLYLGGRRGGEEEEGSLAGRPREGRGKGKGAGWRGEPFAGRAPELVCGARIGPGVLLAAGPARLHDRRRGILLAYQIR